MHLPRGGAPIAARKAKGSLFFVAAWLWVGGLAGCGAPLTVQVARRGKLDDLKEAIARERAAGTLDRERVREIARAVAEREIRSATPADALLRVDEVRSCTRPLSSALEARAAGPDDAAAAATLALLDTRRRREADGEGWLRRHGGSPSALWRAVAARAAVGEHLGPARRKFYVDPDERVRLAALRAALDGVARADGPALLEAARLDPSPLAQALAARALGGLEERAGVLGLRDLYARADEGLRQSIVEAWARKEAAGAGGLAELLRVAENENGAPAIDAGFLLLRFGDEQHAAATGKRALLRGAERGLARDRTLAIALLPAGDREATAALQKAAVTSDVTVKIAALGRLAERSEERPKVLSQLRALAAGGAREARLALARMGDGAALQEVAKDLTSPDPETRLQAARTVVGAGDPARAADLLADPDPHVRTSVSCAVLSSAPR